MKEKSKESFMKLLDLLEKYHIAGVFKGILIACSVVMAIAGAMSAIILYKTKFLEIIRRGNR